MRSVEVIGEKGLESADLFIGAIGYERRARFALEKFSKKSETKIGAFIGLEFPFHQVLDYSENLELFRSMNASTIPGCEHGTTEELVKRFSATAGLDSHPLTLIVDISVMSRQMMANVICAIDRFSMDREIAIHAVYAPATFEKPPITPPMRFAGPVRAEFAGWSSRPDSPLCLIMGLGYEENLALGAISYLEPGRTVLFLPRGLDRRYIPLVREESKKISSHIPAINLEYNLTEWGSSLNLLRRVCEQLLVDGRVVIVPFGPKVFAWNAMLLSLIDGFREVSVWRFSAEDDAEPQNRHPAGEIIRVDLSVA
ncbi:hypothetical protein [Hyphomicrobium facile]|uniref:Uncharacterized protein n=1 Tax=Hyphomicrobium facile TaxID=51670 RepID=A0A1I7NE19_9HYPH|nr:hypothetical protein [Hyphomicrobium facile]SFV32914.1 hypothetical protein SAMN04488557_1771 [Hyphomicrobium facile]